MIYFISDLHLGLGNREQDRLREQDLLQFLTVIERDCERLYILGDLFDYWFEYNAVIPKYHVRTLAALARFQSVVAPVFYLMGNHDFGHKSYFEEELGITIYKNDVEHTLNGKKFYLAHGDGKAYNDGGYLILRKILRHPLSLWLYKWLHPDIGIKLASSTSHSSRMYTDDKDYGKRDGLMDFAEAKIADGADFVLMGHRHRPMETDFETGKYINTGDWLQHRSYASFDGARLELHTLEELFDSRNV